MEGGIWGNGEKANGAALNARGNFCSLKWPLRRKRSGVLGGMGHKMAVGGERGGRGGEKKGKNEMLKGKKKIIIIKEMEKRKRRAGGGVVAALFGLSQPFPGIRQHC